MTHFFEILLEAKAQKFPPTERESFIAKLEQRVLDWNSRGQSLGLLRRHVRRCRMTVLFAIGLTTLFYLLLHMFHVSSMARYVEIIFWSTTMFTVSYVIPVDSYGSEDEDVSKPSDILMNSKAVDSSDAQSLLPKSDEDSADPPKV